ncbi:MAG: DUF21 domain-containing protein [Planctomycetes bacterium]|nr:DUF21 domain-containing protein [Planctomycetota bacterium]
MSVALDLLLLVACGLAAALCAGAETAVYRVSPVRLEMEARAGGRAARSARRLAGDRTALMVVLVLVLDLALLVLVWRVEALLAARGAADGLIDVLLAALLAPAVFFACDLLPKELARRRPHAWLRAAALPVLAVRALLWPIVAPLTSLARRAERGGGGRGLGAGARGREAVLGFLREGQQGGTIPAHAAEMARNVLFLRSIPVERCMTPWARAVRLGSDQSPEAAYALVAAAEHTRIPVTDGEGAVLGYVHQLDVLGDAEAAPHLERLRPIPELPPDLPVDRALARLRAQGQRLAVVGTRAAPVGIVSLKDLLEEISGDLARW